MQPVRNACTEESIQRLSYWHKYIKSPTLEIYRGDFKGPTIGVQRRVIYTITGTFLQIVMGQIQKDSTISIEGVWAEDVLQAWTGGVVTFSDALF